MKYANWIETMTSDFRAAPLWKVEAYRLALFAAEIGWRDVTKLMGDHRTIGLSDQLYRALGSISANVSEGYSRGTGKDRARFYEYALGSARESRGWYYKGRHIVGESVSTHRIHLLTQIIRLLLAMIPDQRSSALKEDQTPYRTEVFSDGLGSVSDPAELHELLENIPLP